MTMMRKAKNRLSAFLTTQTKTVGRAFQIPDWVFGVDYKPPVYQSRAEDTSKRLRESVWTSACLVQYQWASFGVKLIVQKKDKKIKNWVPAEDSKALSIQRCLNRTNVYSTSGEFLFTCLTNLLKDGNVLISRQRLRGPYAYSLEVLHSDGVVPVLDHNDLVKGYSVTKQGFAGTKGKFVKRDDMVHVRFPNSEHLEWGISPLEAAVEVQDGETHAMAWNKSIMSSGGTTNFVLCTKEPLSKSQTNSMRQRIMEGNSIEYAGIPPLLTHGVERLS